MMAQTDPAIDKLKKDDKTEVVDLEGDAKIHVDISDALSEKDKVKFTVHTKANLEEFSKNEMSVIREHEEFIWLHSVLEENEKYAGFILPPPPPKPDFEASREKLQRLGDGESSMVKEEFNKMKAELEAEYLATFKKTVAMHEVFLSRIAAHPILHKDPNFHVFLEYTEDLSVRGKNKKEKLGSIWKRFSQSADEVLLSGQRDIDDFFEHEKNYLIEYHNHIRDATAKADKITRAQKNTLRYFMRDTQAAKDLLYRRLRCLANYEGTNKNLERARAKNKDVQKAEQEQQEACEKFEAISEKAKSELTDFKCRRISSFKKNLTDLAELEMKHAKAQLQLLQTSIASLKEAAVTVA